MKSNKKKEKILCRIDLYKNDWKIPIQSICGHEIIIYLKEILKKIKKYEGVK